jgi:hypothetical protein
MEVLEKTKMERKRPNPWEFWKKLKLEEKDQTHVFYNLSFLPKSYKHEGRKSKDLCRLAKHKWGEVEAF